MIRASVWIRLAIEPGKRCIAGLFRAQGGELVRVVIGDLGGIETAHPVGDLSSGRRTPVSSGICWSKHHPDEQRERDYSSKQLVGLGLLR